MISEAGFQLEHRINTILAEPFQAYSQLQFNLAKARQVFAQHGGMLRNPDCIDNWNSKSEYFHWPRRPHERRSSSLRTFVFLPARMIGTFNRVRKTQLLVEQ